MQKNPTKCPYRAVICGEEHIIEGWHGGNLVTDKDEFVFSRHDNYSVPSDRLLEVALLQLDQNGEWLLNGHNLRSLQSMTFLPASSRLHEITRGEVLRVHKREIHAVAWVQTKSEVSVTNLLDTISNFWKMVSQPAKENANVSVWQEIGLHLGASLSYMGIMAGLSEPIWLKEFYPIGAKNPNLAKLEIASAQPANVPLIKPMKKATKVRPPKPVARFEDDFSIAVVPQKKTGKELNWSIEPELWTLVKEIVAAGGRLSRQEAIRRFTTKLGKGNSENYQPEKLLQSKTAKALIKAGLLGTDKLARTSTFWVKERAV
jgi:hypothetical protein